MTKRSRTILLVAIAILGFIGDVAITVANHQAHVQAERRAYVAGFKQGLQTATTGWKWIALCREWDGALTAEYALKKPGVTKQLVESADHICQRYTEDFERDPLHPPKLRIEADGYDIHP